MKNHRDGGKYGGDHTTFIDLAGELADSIHDRPEVMRISAGFIKSGAGVAGGVRKVKISDMLGGALLTCRQNRSVQEVRIFTKDALATKLAIAREARNNDVAISFGHGK